jgi:hypothetical protein
MHASVIVVTVTATQGEMAKATSRNAAESPLLGTAKCDSRPARKTLRACGGSKDAQVVIRARERHAVMGGNEYARPSRRNR